MGKRFRKTLPNIKPEIKNLVGKKNTSRKPIYHEESLGGVPGGERVPVVEGGGGRREWPLE